MTEEPETPSANRRSIDPEQRQPGDAAPGSGRGAGEGHRQGPVRQAADAPTGSDGPRPVPFESAATAGPAPPRTDGTGQQDPAGQPEHPGGGPDRPGEPDHPGSRTDETDGGAAAEGQGAAAQPAHPGGAADPDTGEILSASGFGATEALAPAPGPAATAPSFGKEPMWADASRNYDPGPLPLEHQGATRIIETGVLTFARRMDRLQSRIAPIAFAYAVFKKYADDKGSRLAALLAYYTFLSIFPLLIAGVALLNRILRNSPDVVNQVVEELVPEDFQDQILASYEALPTSGATLWVAVIGLLLAGTAGAFALYGALNQIFAVPYRYRYGFGPRYLRVLVVLFIMAFAVLITAIGAGYAGAWSSIPGVNRISVAVLTTLVFGGSLYGAAKILCRRQLRAHELLLGAMLGGAIVTAVVSLGSLLVATFVATSTPVYGAFATVIGIISVLLLTSNGIIISLEISVVRAWQLWPRGLDIHLLFPADDRAYVLLSLMDERMPSQRNDVRFDATGHFDPRRPPFDTLNHRQPGVPRTPYDPH